ncbi:MAG: hypothetical protein QXN77_09380 [Candidatus Caldarchaeum sp.]
MTEKLRFKCVLCGDTITDKEYNDETLLSHLLRRHIEYVRSTALGLWIRVEEDDE